MAIVGRGGPVIVSDEQHERIRLARQIAGPERTPEFVARVVDLDPTDVALAFTDPEPEADGGGVADGPGSEPQGSLAEQLRTRTIEVLIERWWDDTDLADLATRLGDLISPPIELWVALAERAAQERAHRIAADAFSHAAALAADRGSGPEEVFELTLSAARNFRPAGDPIAHERHTTWARQLADRSGAPDLLARVVVEQFDPGFTVDTSRSVLFDRAWENLSSPETALAVDLLCSEVYMTYLTDPPSALRTAERAEDLALRVGDHRALVAAADARRIAGTRAIDLAVFERAGEDLLRLARAGDLEARSKGFETLIVVALVLGDPQLIDRRLAAYRANATESASPHRHLYAEQIATLQALASGDLDSASVLIEGAAERVAQLNDPVSVQVSMAQQAMLAFERDQPTSMIAISAEQSTSSPLLRMWNLAALLAGMRSGNEDEVAAGLDVLLPSSESLGDWQCVWLGELMLLGDAAAFVGDVDRCAWIRTLLEPRADHFGVLATALGFGSVARTLGSITAVLGDHRVADDHFAFAEAANRRIGALPWVARGHLAQARHQLRSGQIDGPHELIESAERVADRLGLPRLSREVAEARSLFDAAKAESVGESAALPGLSPRENELLVAVARGSSNRQLAEDHFVSVKTIERHLSNIYAKLGVRGRADAVAWAFANGLVLEND